MVSMWCRRAFLLDQASQSDDQLATLGRLIRGGGGAVLPAVPQPGPEVNLGLVQPIADCDVLRASTLHSSQSQPHSAFEGQSTFKGKLNVDPWCIPRRCGW